VFGADRGVAGGDGRSRGDPGIGGTLWATVPCPGC
jgi:hypothetical protein